MNLRSHHSGINMVEVWTLAVHTAVKLHKRMMLMLMLLKELDQDSVIAAECLLSWK